MTTMRIFWQLVLASVRGQMQYRFDFVMAVGFGVLFQGLGFVFLLLMLGKFNTIAGWSISAVTVLYGVRLMAHGLWVVAFSRLFSIDEMVQQGEWDRVLIRPLPIIGQLMFSSFRVTTLGDLLGGSAMLVAGLVSADIGWTPAKAIYLIAALIGGAMLDGAFQLGCAALTFRTMSTMDLRVVFDDLFSRAGGYPLSIFNRGTVWFFTLVVPLAWFAWIPTTVLLGRTDELPFPGWLAWFSPLIGVGCLAIAISMFLNQSRHYTSAGS